MIDYIEEVLREKAKRVLIIEMSIGQEFALNRSFYEKLGYLHEATVRDFWNEGEDKLVFWKKLNQSYLKN